MATIILQSVDGTGRNVLLLAPRARSDGTLAASLMCERRFKVYEDEFTPPPKRPGPYQAPGRSRHKKGKR